MTELGYCFFLHSSFSLWLISLLIPIIPARSNGPGHLQKSEPPSQLRVYQKRGGAKRRERGQGKRELFPDATMVLLGLGTTWGCTQWLHREDYTVFERSDTPDGKMEEASVASSRVRASGKPSQYWLIGFKDRRLEREYLEDLVEVSSSCFIVGTSLALLLYVIFSLTFGILSYLECSRYFMVETGSVPVGECLRELLLPMIVGGLGIVAAFVVCCVHSMGKWKVRKDVILYVIEGGYLLYTGAVMWCNLDPAAGGLKGMTTLLLLLSLVIDSLLLLTLFFSPL